MNLKKLLFSSAFLASSLFAGVYSVDKSHSSVGFKIKHLMISNVNGSFNDFDGKFEYDEKTKTLKTLEGEVKVSSIDTGNSKRDGHLKADDMFDAKKYPSIKFKVTKIDGDKVYGDFTLRGVTKNIELDFENGGVIVDPWGNTKAGFALNGSINRSDFGLTYNKVLEAGGVALGEKVKLNIEIEGKQIKK